MGPPAEKSVNTALLGEMNVTEKNNVMQKCLHQGFFLVIIAIIIGLFYLLASMLTPFLLGALLAYLTNPLVKRLERRHFSHLISVVIVFTSVIGVCLLFILMLVPLIQNQMMALIEVIPELTIWLQNNVMPWLKTFIDSNTLKSTLSATLSKSGVMVNALVVSGYTLVGWITNLILTPVVMFYLLRDWDTLINKLENALPRSIAPTVIQLTKECDSVLGQFFRGQLIVMLALAFMYGVGLSIVGLQVGLIIGFLGGLLSIVPYLGSIFVVVTASVVAIVQFSTWQALLGVWVVFIIGQIIESYILVPYLIGDRIGLHPVAVIFAIMAGGALFGFFGVLLALPVAAIIVVLLHYCNQRYRASEFYRG